MEVRARSALFITLAVSNAALATDFHGSLIPGVVCSSEDNSSKIQILERPASDGFFKITKGLCKALPILPEEDATLFAVSQCLNDEGQQIAFMFGGWLNMLTARFDGKNESHDLYCR